MTRRKREKDYWEKCKERFQDGTTAQGRAGALRAHEHVSHVKADKMGDTYVVSYSVEKWYLEKLRAAGIEL